MPNPWDRQPRTVECGDPNDPLDCPRCGRLTDSLKHYRYPDLFIFLLGGAIWWESDHTACPPCMRAVIVNRCVRNILPAHLVWPIFLLPWALYLYFATFRRGHGAGVTAAPIPDANLVRDVEAIDEYRVILLACAGVSWVPCFGLVFALIALVMSRHAVGWARYAGPVALFLAGAVHLVLLSGMIIGAASR